MLYACTRSKCVAGFFQMHIHLDQHLAWFRWAREFLLNALSLAELYAGGYGVSRDGKVTSRGTLSTEPSSCKYQPRRKVYTVKPL